MAKLRKVRSHCKVIKIKNVNDEILIIEQRYITKLSLICLALTNVFLNNSDVCQIISETFARSSAFVR